MERIKLTNKKSWHDSSLCKVQWSKNKTSGKIEREKERNGINTRVQIQLNWNALIRGDGIEPICVNSQFKKHCNYVWEKRDKNRLVVSIVQFSIKHRRSGELNSTNGLSVSEFILFFLYRFNNDSQIYCDISKFIRTHTHTNLLQSFEISREKFKLFIVESRGDWWGNTIEFMI